MELRCWYSKRRHCRFDQGEETGFIIEDNTPAVIAENITRATSYHDIGKIVANARDVIERNFTYIKAVERWRRILELRVGE